jgi:hypothetical protein
MHTFSQPLKIFIYNTYNISSVAINIPITIQEIEKAKEFATIKAPLTPSPIKRNDDKKFSDIIEGKLGEIALAKLLNENRIYVEVDFLHYQHGEDDADFNWSEIQIDVKTIPYYSSWLLIPAVSFDNGKRCHFYPLVRINKEMTHANILGYAIADDILKSKKGQWISNNYKLDLINYQLHYTTLRDARGLAEHIENSSRKKNIFRM